MGGIINNQCVTHWNSVVASHSRRHSEPIFRINVLWALHHQEDSINALRAIQHLEDAEENRYHPTEHHTMQT